MGPKEKKPKKLKLTKAEKEKLKKEEAEQKAKEEEESRLLAEQAEIERQEQERIEAEERRLLEERERVRHQAEIDELHKNLEKNKEHLVELKKIAQQKNKWDRYMMCDGRPDPTYKKDINSYINLALEESKDLKLEKVLKTCELILELISELDQHIEELTGELEKLSEDDPAATEAVIEKTTDSSKEEKDANVVVNERNNVLNLLESYKETKVDLQNLINCKIDEASFALLKSPKQNIDPDDFNIQLCEKTDHLKICLWGNSAKNPRVKQIRFLKDEFTMELPKQMAVLDIAVRVSYMDFDPFSHISSLYYMKVPSKVDLPSEIPVIDVEQDQNLDELNVDRSIRNDMQSSLSVALSNKMNALSTKDMRVKSRLGTAMSNTNSTKGGSKLVIKQPSVLPPKADVIEAVDQPVLVDDDLIDDDVVDLRLFSTMGPLIYIDLLQLPPQPKEVKGWVMQQVICGGGLVKIPYGTTDDQSLSQESMKSVEGFQSATNTPLSVGYNQPLAITLRVDEKVMFHDDPQIARWDKGSFNWKLDGLSGTEYNAETGILSFQTSYFGPYAVIQDKYLSLPFQAWQLYPKGLNECVLNLISATVEVDILIKEGECCVQFPTETKIAHVADKWMKPAQLMETLRRSGINLFPYEDGHKYVKIYPKMDALVTPVYQYMALLASSFSFMLSKWNIECGEDKVVVQALEWTEAESPANVTHHLYLGSTRICCQLKMQEDDEEFSKDVVPNSPMHPDLYHMLRNGASDDAKERLKDSSIVFIDCVHQLLKASNVLVYS